VRTRASLIVLAGVAVAGMLLAVDSAQAQAAPGPGAAAARGFSTQLLVAQLSLYLPEEATRGMPRGFGPQGRQDGTGGAGQGGRQGGQGAGGQGGAGAIGGRGFPQIQFKRDPALFLTKEQISKLLPLLVSLRENPLPTPSKAKQVQADVDAILTAGQKAEWVDFQKKLQALIEEFRQRVGASGSGAGGPGAAGPSASAPGAAGPEAQGSGPQMTLLQRRQRQLDAFIAVLQDRLKQVST
jgi:hypothetical protein